MTEKTTSSLLDVLAVMRERRVAGGATLPDWSDLSTPLVRVNQAGEIQVYVILAEFRPEFVRQLEALGLRVELTHEQTVQGWVPADAIESIAALDFVRQIRPPGYALHNQSGAVDTAGNSILGANDARAAFGVSGASVPIGVISNGVDHLANSISSGDLPPQGTILLSGGGDEGTAMMEIIHDLAPASPLLFFGTDGFAAGLEMANGINALAAAGARVIVDDVTFPDQPKFEDGPIAQAARNFATGGRLYVTSANNFALRHYRAQYNPVNVPVTFGGRSYARHHNYAATGTDIFNRFTLPAGCQVKVFLQWNDPQGAASDDFDLALVRASDGIVVAMSQTTQSGTQDGSESLVFTTPITQTLFITIPEFKLSNPPSSITLDYFVRVDCLPEKIPLLQYNVADSSVWGQGAVSEVISVAAVNANTPGVIESYSAHGPGAISFPAPENRAVPNITGVDCVQTRVGQLGFFDDPFCGTSAAAPHVAAIAALMIERNPTLSSDQLRSILFNTAVDLGAPGYDFTYGFGRVDAFASVQAVPPFNTPLAAAILPSSRSVQVGGTATAFATILNGGGTTATDCAISPAMAVPATFIYQTTDPSTNTLTGSPNTPASIPAGEGQSFLIAFTMGSAFGPTDVTFTFSCSNVSAARVISGVNTMLLSASSSPAPDVIMIAATSPNDGIVRIANGLGALAVATSNVGASGNITISADTGAVSLPISLSVCQTNPSTGACFSAPQSSVTTFIGARATPTFSVFVNGFGNVPFNAAVNRVFIRAKDLGGVTRGATSVAVRTQ
jgi:hypothetical protein